MASNPPGRCCTLGSLFECVPPPPRRVSTARVTARADGRPRGTPTGSALKVDGNIDAYLAKAPEDKARKGRAILYLPDVFGVWQNSKVMADAFASCGYTTLVLDLFDGDALTLNQLATLDIGKWLSEGTDGKHPHTVEQVDPIVLAGIKALRGMGFDKIAAVGYCFGAKVRGRRLLRRPTDSLTAPSTWCATTATASPPASSRTPPSSTRPSSPP